MFKAFQGTLGEGSDRLLAAYRAMDEMGALAYRVWYYAALQYDQDQRDNTVNARRQQVQILFARQQQASSWFNPELLAIPIETIRGWLDAHAGLAVYRFAVESLFHEQEHVLDERGERLMSYAGRFNSIPHDSYAALTTADMKFPSITLSTGERVTLSYGQYRAVLETNRVQDDRASAYRAFHRAYAENQNTYAALYNGVLQRDWFHARARAQHHRPGSNHDGSVWPLLQPERVRLLRLLQGHRCGASPDLPRLRHERRRSGPPGSDLQAALRPGSGFQARG